jgi:phage N-6-adenine-methyltransferase
MQSKEGMEVYYSSEDLTWETPPEIFALLDKEFNFTLDPCCVKATAKCETYFTPEDDGLAQSWEGHTVFMNPPYGREIGPWMHKAAEESALNGLTVVCLVPSRTDPKWWHDTVMQYNADVRFVRGRLKFGTSESGAPFSSAIVIFAPWAKSRMSGQERE